MPISKAHIRHRNRTRKVFKGPKVELPPTRKKRASISRSGNGGGAKSLRIRYGIHNVADQRLSRAEVIERPEVMFDIQEGKQYTLILYDPDSPNPDYIHWLVTNITNNTPPLTVLPYESPNPPSSHTHYHTYMFELLEQSGPLRINVIERAGNSIHKLKKQHGLRTLDSCGFYIDPQM